RGTHLGAAAPALVDEALRPQRRERRVVGRAARRLARRLGVEVEAEPGEVLAHAGLPLRPAAIAVEVLDAQQQATARLAHLEPGEQGGARVAEVHAAARARRVAADRHGLVGRHCKYGTGMAEGRLVYSTD